MNKLRWFTAQWVSVGLVFALCTMGCGSGSDDTTEPPPVPVGKLHTNEVYFTYNTDYYYDGYRIAGCDLPDCNFLTGVKVSGFTLLDNKVTKGQAPGDDKDVVYCDGDSGTLPCECKEGDHTGEGGDDGNCGFSTDDEYGYSHLRFHVGRSKSKDVGKWFQKWGKSVPLPADWDSDAKYDYQKAGFYPDKLNFVFAARVTFMVPKDDNSEDDLYISCQDMLFAQVGEKEKSGKEFETAGTKETFKIANDAKEVVLDPDEVDSWGSLDLDVGTLAADIASFFEGFKNVWFLAGARFGGFAIVNWDTFKIPSVTFKCPATNGYYYAVRVSPTFLGVGGSNDHGFEVHQIQMIDEQWADDHSVECNIPENKESVVCEYPSCQISGNSSDGGWYGGYQGQSCEETCDHVGLDCDLATTLSIGSDAENKDECWKVLESLGAEGSSAGTHTGHGNAAIGCEQWWNNDFAWVNSPETTCAAKEDKRCRACACS
jgi:hypothetical protein